MFYIVEAVPSLFFQRSGLYSLFHQRSGLFFVFVNIIYAEQCAGKGGNFAKADEERFMDLSVWLYEDAAEKHHKSAQGEHGSG